VKIFVMSKLGPYTSAQPFAAPQRTRDPVQSSWMNDQAGRAVFESRPEIQLDLPREGIVSEMRAGELKTVGRSYEIS